MNGLVSLTFDDVLPQHLDVVIPLLDEAKLTGTFYTHLAAPALSSRWTEWQQAAATGHELGNHTAFHPATGLKSWVKPGYSTEEYSLERMREELLLANAWLTALDGQAQRTFAYPCANRMLGTYGWPVRALQWLGLRQTRLPKLVESLGCDWGSTRTDYLPLAQNLFYAARAGGLTLDIPTPRLTDFQRWSLPSVSIERQPWREIQAYVSAGLGAGTWVILQFHGVGGGHSMNCEDQLFRDLIHWLADQHATQVVTVREGTRRIWDHAEMATTSQPLTAGTV